MVELPKFVIMVFPTGLQGAVWQKILRSQQVSVLWESPDVDLTASIRQLKAANFALPDLILIDTRLQTFNPYKICRWCRQNCSEIKIVLVNGAQKEILPAERQWALYQGASDLLPRFQREKLVSGAAIGVRRVLDLLNSSTLDSKALVSILLSVKR